MSFPLPTTHYQPTPIINFTPQESEAKTLARQLLSAVAYIHDKGIIHRDIKVANLLYNHKGQLKLAGHLFLATTLYTEV
jgi:serine/threonine protein kinase